MRKRKNFLSATPLRLVRNSLILALKDSAIALDERLLLNRKHLKSILFVRSGHICNVYLQITAIQLIE